MTHQPYSDQATYTVRLAQTAAELKTILKVRYEIMSVDFSMYTPVNTVGIDIDQWDAQAFHLGLWRRYRGREEPIGYMRIIQTEPLSVQVELRKILNEYPCLKNQCKRFSVNPIRFLEVFKEYKEARSKFDRLPNEKVMEGSRLSVKKEYRASNPGRFLSEASFAIFHNSDLFPHSFIEVRENHLPAYNRFGFRQVASKYVPEDGCNHFLCYAHSADLPGHLTEKISTMRQEHLRNGEITFRPQLPTVQMPLSTVVGARAMVAK